MLVNIVGGLKFVKSGRRSRVQSAAAIPPIAQAKAKRAAEGQIKAKVGHKHRRRQAAAWDAAWKRAGHSGVQWDASTEHFNGA